MKRIIIILLASIGIAYGQPSYTVFELPLGKLEGWKRDKTTNPNATDKLPVYYVAGDYLLRIEPTNNYHTQLFDREFKLVWETNTPLMEGSPIDFTNHANAIFNSNKFIYQIDYGLNYGGGVFKVIDIATGENKSTPFKIGEVGAESANIEGFMGKKSNPFFVDDMMYIVQSGKQKKTYLYSFSSSGEITKKEINNLSGTTDYTQISYASSMGGWMYSGVGVENKHLVHKIYLDNKSSNLMVETAWLGLSGSTSSPETYTIEMQDKSVIDANAISWNENGKANTLLVAFGNGGKDDGYKKKVFLHRLTGGKIINSTEYSFGEDIVADEWLKNWSILGLSHPTIEGAGFNFKITYHQYIGANVYKCFYQLNLSVDKDLKLTQNNKPENDVFENTIKNLNEYQEPPMGSKVDKSVVFDGHRKLHAYLCQNHPMVDKSCRYVGLYFNHQFVVIRDDFFTVKPIVFQFSFE